MNKLVLSASLAAVLLAAGGAAAQNDRATSPAPPPSGMDAMSSGIAERAAKLREDVRQAYARGAIRGDEADAIGRSIEGIESHFIGHVPRGFRERQRLRERLDALQARFEKATSHS